jgi:hypothetical protein
VDCPFLSWQTLVNWNTISRGTRNTGRKQQMNKLAMTLASSLLGLATMATAEVKVGMIATSQDP